MKSVETFCALIRSYYDNGHVMRPMAMGLSDKDTNDVVAYIMTLDANYVEED